MQEVTSRRNFLTSAAGIAAGGTALALAAVPARAVSRPDDPVFAAIEEHHKVRNVVMEAVAAMSRAEQESHESGAYPRVISKGNQFSCTRPVSSSHADIDRYSPAWFYPQDNAREHEELSALILRRDVRINPFQDALNAAWDAEEPRAVGDLVHVEKFFARNLGSLTRARTCAGPAREGKSRTPSMYADEKSDEAAVPRKRPNKGRQLPAEVVERRASPEGNSRQVAVVRTLSRDTTSIRLAAVRRSASGFKPRAGRRVTRGRSPVR
jgi:hypothetical protein